MGDGGSNAVGLPARLRTRSGAERARAIYFVAAAVLAALIPLVLFAGLWMRAVLDDNERDLQTYLTARAGLLAERIEREIGQQVSILQAMASVPSLDGSDLARFQETATRMAGALPEWAVVALIDPATGRQVMNTLRPLGSDLPQTTAPDVVRRVFEERRWLVRTRYAGEGIVYDAPTVLLYVPVIRADAVRFVLVAGLKTDVVQRLLSQVEDGGVLAVVVDENERILARSRSAEEFLGRSANEQLRLATAGRTSGLFSAETLDDHKVFTAFRRSGPTGWLSVAAIDRQHFDALGQRSTWTLIVTGALGLTLAVVLAIILFYNVVERRVSDERYAASKALSELDARLLRTTQEALAEQRKSASEREVLLREIYHRVKNNLQIVQSLLRLGSRGLEPDQREPFESAIRRIGAMARVHSLLYKSPDLASIDFKDYLDDIVRETADGFGGDLRGIRTETDAQSMRVPLDIAVPLAFIAVELLTNAFKHAFPGGRRGTISVSARQENDHGLLTVSDDGVGLPSDAAGAARRPLGLSLVNKLVDQIGGTLETPGPGESTYRVTFPLTPPETFLPEALAGTGSAAAGSPVDVPGSRA
jgi:two-component sensor histidine kinase